MVFELFLSTNHLNEEVPVKKINHLFKTNNGSTLVGVMAAIVFVGIVTTFMTSMTQNQFGSTQAFTSLQTATMTSNSALRIAEAYLNQESETALEILKAVEEDGPQWLFPHGNNSATLADGQTYNAKILSFDLNTFTAVIEATGWGRGTGVKRTVGVYALDNLEKNEIDNIFSNALYVKGKINTQAPLSVDGDTYIGGNQDFNSENASYNGNFIWNTTSTTEASINSSVGVTFNGPAYFNKENLKINGSVTFNAGAAFQQRLTTTINNPDIITVNNKGLILNGGVQHHNNTNPSEPDIIDMGNNTLYYHGQLYPKNESSVDAFKNAPNKENEHKTDEQIIELLSVDSAEPINIGTLTEHKFDDSKIDEDIIQNLSTLFPRNTWNGSDLQKAYDDTPQHMKINGFMVIKVDKNTFLRPQNPYDNTINMFNGKVIFLVENNLSFGNQMYQSGAQANTVFVVTEGSTVRALTNRRFEDNFHFRGMIYTDDGNIAEIGGQSITNDGVVRYNGGTFTGAIHVHGENDELSTTGDTGDDPNNININYDEDVLKEISNTGLFGGLGGDNEPIITDGEAIEPRQLSVYQY